METYIVSALKYRPQSFEEVVGQKAITKTLENAIEKDQLAQAVVERFVDRAAAEDASAEFTRVFAEKALPDKLPEVTVPAEEVGLLTLMVQADLAKSNGEARRLVKQGAVRIDDERVSDERAIVMPKEGMVLRSGKRGFAKIIIG